MSDETNELLKQILVELKSLNGVTRHMAHMGGYLSETEILRRADKKNGNGHTAWTDNQGTPTGQ